MISNIYLDIGNSLTKWKYDEHYFEDATKKFNLNQLPNASRIWTSNVCKKCNKGKKSNLIVLKSSESYKKLINSYKDPSLLGSDRWFAMIASYEKSTSKCFIVIDIGTAVTIDLVDNKSEHQGGVIFPGLERIRNTFDFPPLASIGDINGLGQSTEDAWGIGTLYLIANTINQKNNELKKRFPSAEVFLTGGGYFKVKKYLNFTHHYHKHLVLDGLEYYVNNVG